jgi:tRNA G46 methylase TrmB
MNTLDESEDFRRIKISPQLKRQGDIKNRFKTDNNFYFHNPFLKKNEKHNNMKNSTSSSQTTTTYDLSLEILAVISTPS